MTMELDKIYNMDCLEGMKMIPGVSPMKRGNGFRKGVTNN